MLEALKLSPKLPKTCSISDRQLAIEISRAFREHFDVTVELTPFVAHIPHRNQRDGKHPSVRARGMKSSCAAIEIES